MSTDKLKRMVLQLESCLFKPGDRVELRYSKPRVAGQVKSICLLDDEVCLRVSVDDKSERVDIVDNWHWEIPF